MFYNSVLETMNLQTYYATEQNAFSHLQNTWLTIVLLLTCKLCVLTQPGTTQWTVNVPNVDYKLFTFLTTQFEYYFIHYSNLWNKNDHPIEFLSC